MIEIIILYVLSNIAFFVGIVGLIKNKWYGLFLGIGILLIGTLGSEGEKYKHDKKYGVHPEEIEITITQAEYDDIYKKIDSLEAAAGADYIKYLKQQKN